MTPFTDRDREIAKQFLAGGQANLTNKQQVRAVEVVSQIGQDYRIFLGELWIAAKLDKVAPLSEIELDMAAFASSGPRRRGVLAFRGFGKTHVVPAGLTAFRHYRDRNRQILIVSKSEKETKKTASLVRQWYDRVWFLKHLAPLSGQRDAATYFDVGNCKENRQPSLSVIGIDGQLEGNRAHSIFPDDVETKNNTKTIEGRAELRRLCREFRNILYPTNDLTAETLIDPMEIVHVGTPKHEETLFLDLIKAGYAFQAYPIMYPPADVKTISLAPMLRDHLDTGKARPNDYLVPKRFGMTEVSERRAEGLHDFMMESMLVADLGESARYPLRISDLVVMDVHRDLAPTQIVYGERNSFGSTEIPTSDIPHDGFANGHLYRPAYIGNTYLPYHGTKAFIDPAGRGLDKTGVAVVSSLNGMLFVKCVHGLEGGASSNHLDEIAQLLRQHNTRDAYVEDNIDTFNTYYELLDVALQKHFLRPGEHPDFPDGWMCSLERRRSTVQKELRIIAALEPVLSNHRLIITPEALRPRPGDRDIDALLWQISRITRDRQCLKEDGKIDALASCVKEWQYAVRVNPDQQRQQSEERASQAQVEEMIRKMHEQFGVPYKAQEPSWIVRR